MMTEEESGNYKDIIPSSSPVTNTKISKFNGIKVKTNMVIINLSCMKVYLTIFSDNFEPNRVKQYKESTWLETITIAPPQDYQESLRHMYIIALSKKKK